MAAVQRIYSTESPIGSPRFRLILPTRDARERELAEPADRDLLQALFGRARIPNRPSTPGEHEALTLLLAVLQEQRWTGTWSDLSFGVDPDLAQRFIEEFAGDTVRGLGLLGPEQVLELFGQGIYLGPERLVFLQAQLANQRAVRARLAEGADRDAPVELHFVPAENTMVDSIYEQTPRILKPWGTDDLTARLSRDAFKEHLLGDYLHSRPGRWNIAVTRTLRAPIELPEDPGGQMRGWTLDVPDRVSEGLEQLDRAERSAVLAALWDVQRRGERGLGAGAQRLVRGDDLLYVLRPTTEVRVLLQLLPPTTARVVEIVRDRTLQMFRER